MNIVRSYLLQSLSIGVEICWLLPTSINYAKMLGQNHFVEPNQQKILIFLHPILMCKVAYPTFLGMFLLPLL